MDRRNKENGKEKVSKKERTKERMKKRKKEKNYKQTNRNKQAIIQLGKMATFHLISDKRKRLFANTPSISQNDRLRSAVCDLIM